jgi:hypothetical protein
VWLCSAQLVNIIFVASVFVQTEKITNISEEERTGCKIAA